MTRKLYYEDSHMREFSARVLSCTECGDGFAVILDCTAFFPEGGGQLADTGFIGPAQVRDVQEINGEIVHYVNQAPDVGADCECRIDWDKRFRRMQNHSGEHIVSGLVHAKYGFNNVGFHMGSDLVTIDFDGDLSTEQLDEIERRANQAVADNLTIRACFPPEDELRTLEYRSKLELTENVRIVKVGDIDVCACCAPHVNTTAEIGIIKMLGHERRRRGGEGTRISMLCGLDAYDNYVIKQKNAEKVSVMLSAKQNETAAAVERVMAEQEKLKRRISELSMSLAGIKADSIENTDGNICIFDDVLDEPALREIINVAAGKCGGLAAVFSGSDECGYRYIMGSTNIDLRAASKIINAGINGRGGGSSSMIQGSCTANAETIYKFIKTLKIIT